MIGLHGLRPFEGGLKWLEWAGTRLNGLRPFEMV
jgi:hypothetical protein